MDATITAPVGEEPTETRDPEMRQARGIVHIHTVTGGCQAEVDNSVPATGTATAPPLGRVGCPMRDTVKAQGSPGEVRGSPYLAPCQPGVRAAHPAER